MPRRSFRVISFLFLLVVLPAFAGLLTVFLCDRHIERASAGRHTDSIADLSATRVALVLGCAETLGNGRTNLYFTARMDAAATLYHAGKCRQFLVSGDNGRKDYDEPTCMAAALQVRGVPASAITLDYAGFDTLDSIVRSGKVFGLERLIIVSQGFHNERALYIARHYGIDAQGWDAADVPFHSGLKTRLREKLARVKMILDVHVLRSSPKYLGPKITVGGDV